MWNVGFNGILKLQLPPGVQLICYADEAYSLVNQMLEAATTWIKLAGLKVAAQKIEEVLSTESRKSSLQYTYLLREVQIKIGRCQKYLDQWLMLS